MNTTYEELAKLGTHLKGQLDQFISDRNLCEIQWLKNLRQYAGKYDPDILANIPDERSQVYPRDTRVKVKGGVAKMMEMMFPSTERNWQLDNSPNPSIPEDDLQRIIDILDIQEQETGEPKTSEDIEREVQKLASKRKEKMEQEIADQLADPGVDYPQMCKRILRSGYIYGFGIARSPMVKTQKERMWVMGDDGKYKAETKKIRRPFPESIRIWDSYPDLSAKSWEDQELFFERFVLTRHDFGNLKKRPDFKENVISDYLKEHATGNYTAKTYESELQILAKTSNLTDRTIRRYEVYRALGFFSAHTLAAAGVDIAENEMDQDILADIWFIDDKIIKAQKAVFGTRPSDQYHAFIYTEDEDAGLTGIGLPEETRDSQMAIAASTRALMDNMAATAGPIFEVNTDLLPSGRKTIGPIHAFMTIEREGDSVEAQYPAVRAITTESHVGEILNIISMQRQQLDIESNLPAFTMGNIQEPLGEAFRTTNNMSMMMGSANMVTKDTVRAFDKFTTSLVGSLLSWNMEFNDKEEIKGDYQVVAKGNLSLVAKEIRGAALDQFITTLSEEERAILDTYGVLIDRLRARDLPTDRVLPRKEAEQVLAQMREAAAQNAQIEQDQVVSKTEEQSAKAEKTQTETQVLAASADATIEEILSRAEHNLANAKSSEERTQLENLRTLLSVATGGGGE